MALYYVVAFGLGPYMIFGRSLPLVIWLVLMFFIGKRVGRGRI